MAITVVLADDHPMILDGVEHLLGQENDVTVVARCLDGPSALAAAREFRPDVLVLDLAMPGQGGLEISRKLKDENLGTRVVLYTGAIDGKSLAEAAAVGVKGIALKESPPSFLVECIRRVAAGLVCVDPGASVKVYDTLGRREPGTLLTQRELELVEMIGRGLRNKEIADLLCVTEGTVKTHLHNIFQKIDVKSRLELLHYAKEAGLA